ncbi:phage major capsid protein [Staphylococcus saprophyticus]|uniref:phage major capsid protein n=1 Tax=Staphylococcus saprophyticus TaxID=29385 RepID=UPI000659FE7E|nr:phage major capsid protein [Staphylococcus saprophyticus]RXS11766.1 phage major capsid protein [Staphylococcus saprophyticus]CRV31530.1 phage protein [Streptococcus equi subsp. equi]
MENLKELRSLRADQVEQAEKAVEAGKPEEAQDALEEIKKLDERITAVEEEIKELTDKEKGSKDEASKEEPVKQEGEQRSMNQFKPSVNENKESTEYRGFMQYLKSKGQVRDGVKSVDADVIIPKDIVTQPVTLPETVVDLKQFANVTPVKTAQGSYPVLESATEVMHTVEELEKNPELAKPKFKQVDYKVATYRGAVAVSQESLDDSDADLAKIIAENNARQQLNTTNKAIADVMKTFTAKEISSLDGIKEIINVDLDPAYNLTLVVTQSFYQELDTLKDKNGQYLLKQDITAPSGQALFGRPIAIVRDELLGAKGDKKAFVGDIKHAILFADRVQSSVKWVDNDIYGQVLAIATRFDVKKAVEEAGVFVSYSAPSESTDGAGA